jgi:hypothetical protein
MFKNVWNCVDLDCHRYLFSKGKQEKNRWRNAEDCDRMSELLFERRAKLLKYLLLVISSSFTCSWFWEKWPQLLAQ